MCVGEREEAVVLGRERRPLSVCWGERGGRCQCVGESENPSDGRSSIDQGWGRSLGLIKKNKVLGLAWAHSK